MAVMGLRFAARSNGVARLHGDVSREMFGGMWPELPAVDAPIGHVTNGVHARSWVSDRVDEMLTETTRRALVTSRPPTTGRVSTTSTAP